MKSPIQQKNKLLVAFITNWIQRSISNGKEASQAILSLKVVILQNLAPTLKKAPYFSFLILLLVGINTPLGAEGTSALAPSTADEVALYIGAGDTGDTGGDYGQFAWKDSDSKFYFNIQNTCEKVYMGFSIPKTNRNLSTTTTIEDLLFRIIDPNGNPLNDLSCFGNTTIAGEVWQTLTSATANITARSQADNGPSQLGNTSGYNAFELDLSACGLTLTGNYSIEFFTTNPAYTPAAGYYVEFFDVTVADCSAAATTGRVWSNNWCLGIKRDGDGSFDRAFNGAFYVCSKEGFITKIEFNTGTNTRAEAGKDTDQRSGFRAGAFNVSFNTSGTSNTGSVATNRQSLVDVNAANAELPVFLNIPDPALCIVPEIGAFQTAPNFLSGCPGNRCINVVATKTGQIEVLIEGNNSNGVFDDPSDVLLAYSVEESDFVSDPQTAGFNYEVCVPWNGKDGNGNLIAAGDIKISGFYFQGIYHFPVYDAEFNDDGFIVETINPALGVQKVYYDDTLITQDNNSGESKNGTSGCTGPCHRWTGEWEDFTDKTEVYGNFNTINTWWFASTQAEDFTSSINNQAPLSIVCPADFTGCPSSSIDPSVTGTATSPDGDANCTVVIEYTDEAASGTQCTGAQTITRTWTAYYDGTPEEKISCIQTITLEDRVAPVLVGVPAPIMVSCGDIPTAPVTITVTDNCDAGIAANDIVYEEVKEQIICTNSYTIKRTWTIADACGNSTVGQQFITVTDIQAPVLSGVPADITVTCDNIPVTPNTITISDNCDSDIYIDYQEQQSVGSCPSNYTITRSWTATDGCNNTISESQMITVEDTQSPTWVTPAGSLDATNECSDEPTTSDGSDARSTISNSRSADPANTPPVATDNCDLDNLLVTKISDLTEPGTCSGSSARVITWRATDGCGNTSTDFITTINTNDTTKPTWDEYDWTSTTDCDAIPTVEPTATDNCSDEVSIILVEETKEEGDCAGNYTLTRKWRAKDDCGNQRIKNQTITVLDTIKPDWGAFQWKKTVDCTAIPAAQAPPATDNCSADVTIVLVNETTEAGDCAGLVTVRKWKATDECGNSRTRKETITVIDTIKPDWEVFNWTRTIACDAIVPTAAPTATDNCGADVAIVLVEETTEAGDCSSLTIVRKWNATDACGNSRTRKQFIKFKDTTKPTWEEFKWVSAASCDAIPPATGPTALDNCDTTIDITLVAETTEAGDCAGKYTLIREWQATDDCGNQRTRKQTINIKDTTQPDWVDFPTAAPAECDAIPAAVPPAATDNCDDEVDVILLAETTEAGTCAGKYTLFREWQATDDCGNQRTKKQRFNIKDTTKPEWSNFPEASTVNCDAIPDPAAPAATDNCDDNVLVELMEETQVAGDCPILYKINRKWRATDVCGNQITKTEVIKIKDNRAPLLQTVASNLTLDCADVNFQTTLDTWLHNYGGATATDNCSDLTWLHDCPELSNVCGTSFTVTFAAIDACDNTTTTSAIVSIVDTKAPTWTTATNSLDRTYPCGAIMPNLVPPTATDNCGQATVSIATDVTNAGTCGGASQRVITWKAVDDCGNTSSNFITTISIKDDTPPTLVGVPADIKMTCGTIPNAPTVTATDQCAGTVVVTFQELEENQTCPNSFTIVRIWTATDNCGNTIEVEQNIIIADTEAPTITGVPTNMTAQCGAIPAVPTTIVATDNCDANVNIQFSESPIAGTCAGNSLYRTWTATDMCGNTSTLTQTITFEDTTPPTLTCPADVALQTDNGCGGSAKVTIDLPTATDNCSATVPVTSSEDMEADFPTGTTVVTLTATDACENVTTCDFSVTVSGDDSQLVATNCPDDLVVNCEDAQGQALVSWEPPSGNVCCSACTGTTEIAGFVFMGERGGHRYYCSKDKANWEAAVLGATSIGGHLAVINDPAENAFLANLLEDQNAYIGLSDANSEGSFYWNNNAPLTYTNWFTGQPNNRNDDQHYVQMLPDGRWNDTHKSDILEYMVEISCINVQQTTGPLNGGAFPVGTTTVTYTMSDNCGKTETCSFDVTVNPSITLYMPEDVEFNCHENLSGAKVEWTGPYASSCCDDCPPPSEEMTGFVYMGRYKGHQYYCSKEKRTWQQAQAKAASMGGYLAVINDAEENAILANFLAGQSAYIGFSDDDKEGIFRWVNGEPTAYTNWEVNQPSNSNGDQDFVQMIGNGKWDDIYSNQNQEYVVEIPCLEVQQIAGPTSGSIFQPGTTTVTYETTDNCGNTATESFDVKIKACAVTPPPTVCTAKAQYDHYFWIERVRVGAINNKSGRDGGYGDYMHLSTSMTKGSLQTVMVTPKFSNNLYSLYWTIWIDYNQDGDFNDSGEHIFSHKEKTPLQIKFKVPPTAKAGQTRMRIAMKYGNFAQNCEHYNYGEVEDYTVVIKNPSTLQATAESRSSYTPTVEVLANPYAALPIGAPLELGMPATPSMQVFPNPVKHQLTVALTNVPTTTATLQLYNNLGQIVYTQEILNTHKPLTLNVENYKTGIYFISLNGSGLKPILQKFTKF